MTRRLGFADQVVLADEHTFEPIRGGGRHHDLFLPLMVRYVTSGVFTGGVKG